MLERLHNKAWKLVTEWLTAEPEDAVDPQLSDFERMRFEIRPADVVLVEGRSRVSEIIKRVTLSSWTHSALYIGRLHDVEDEDLREYLAYHYNGNPAEPLVIEALLGEGIVVTTLSQYRRYHLRICRPKGLSRRDAERIIRYCVGCIGLDYDVRQLLDLARFMLPYSLLPRRWRSSLFRRNAGLPTRTVCSTMIGEAFHEVHYPVLPLVLNDERQTVQLRESNRKLFTPRDFDYSPYFEIIKYPMFGFDELAVYRQLPWGKEADEDVAEDAAAPRTEEANVEDLAAARQGSRARGSWANALNPLSRSSA